MMQILEYFDKNKTPWDHQKKNLLQIEEIWDNADVIILPAQVASGKSLIATCVANWRKSKGEYVALLTPKVILQEQYTNEFKDIPSLKGKFRYPCSTYKGLSCGDVEEVEGRTCCGGGCYTKQKELVSKAKTAIFNIHSYMYSTESRNVMIIDEAHTLYPILEDTLTITLWKHKEKYPDGMQTAGDVAIWLHGQIDLLNQKKKDLLKEDQTPEIMKVISDLSKLKDKYYRVYKGLQEKPANFFIEKISERYRNKIAEGLRVRPTTMEGLKSPLWGDNTKLLLMSGTISEIDIKQLNLQFGKRVKWIQTTSPIPPSRRPIYVNEGFNMSYKYQDKNLPLMAKKLEELSKKHKEKGVIHTTYAMAEKFKKLIKDPRMLYHTPDDKEEVLQEFLNSKDKVLVACGMAEGLDLAGENYTWQVITKIMWPNKSDLLWDKRYQENMPYIMWETLKTTIQQTGRICRGVNDYGVTYILDSSFGNKVKGKFGFYQMAKKQIPHMFPEGWEKGIIWS